MRRYETCCAIVLGFLFLAACGSETSDKAAGSSADTGGDAGDPSASNDSGPSGGTATDGGVAATSGGMVNGSAVSGVAAATSGGVAAATSGGVGSAAGGGSGDGTTGASGGSGGAAGADGVDTGVTGSAGAPSEPIDPLPVPSGVLTAGIWDDNRNFDWFSGYYEDQQGDGLSGWFRSGDHQAAQERFLQQSGSYDTLDLSLVIDTTGSMGDELAYLQTEFKAISSAIEARYQNAEQRWSLIVYRDVGDQYVTLSFDFTSDLDAFRADLAAQTYDGGGDTPEAPDQALRDMNQLAWRDDPKTLKLAFWVADAPHHDDEESVDTLTQAILDAQAGAIRINPIASSGIDEFTEFTMRSAAQLTLGHYMFLTDDSGVGGGHKDPTVPCYYVTTLADAFLRVVDAGMAGEPVPVDKHRVVRSVGGPDSNGVCQTNQASAVAF
jgi:hypothetical protein